MLNSFTGSCSTGLIVAVTTWAAGNGSAAGFADGSVRLRAYLRVPAARQLWWFVPVLTITRPFVVLKGLYAVHAVPEPSKVLCWRQQQVAELCEHLMDQRLLTLVPEASNCRLLFEKRSRNDYIYMDMMMNSFHWAVSLSRWFPPSLILVPRPQRLCGVKRRKEGRLSVALWRSRGKEGHLCCSLR